MKIFILDITARNAVQYDPALCNSIGKISIDKNDIYLLSNTRQGRPQYYKFVKLLNFVPEKYNGNRSKLKRLIRAIEVFINYFYVIILCLFKKPDILHLQWIPFVDICTIERNVFKLINIVSPRTKIFLTVHNIYPHDFMVEKRLEYRNRFLKVGEQINGYFVHLISAKEELSKEYGIPASKIHVSYHGIYKPEGYKPHNGSESSKLRMVMYGVQNKYKGADILINALKLLPKNLRDKTETYIMGKTDQSLYDSCIGLCEDLHVTWNNSYVTDDFLYEKIGESDLILLPYRKISQSGVLLLALSFGKSILTSDLPSFKETLEGYTNDMFFESENPESLSRLIKRYIEGDIDIDKQVDIIKSLTEKYSWKETAKATINGYLSNC